MPPTLGQGASLTLMNAHALAVTLAKHESVPAALEEWERRIRFLSDATQKWSVMYDRFTSRWPSAVRPAVIRAFGRIRFLNDRMRIADRGLQLTGFVPGRAGG
jgi:2-polyprenyl-6-methoxyphenol hydroxylase-like FAD-dependent oxidoreductase